MTMSERKVVQEQPAAGLTTWSRAAYGWSRLPKELEYRIRFEPKSKCWLWEGRITGRGYGYIQRNNNDVVVHRVVYELLKGPISTGLVLDHLCRVRHCVNPDHLEPVTRKENISRGDNWQREKMHCPKGHPYDAVNTGYELHTGYRRCKICHRENSRVFREQVKNMKIIYTYTNLNCYNSICPHQFYRRYIKKDLPFTETPAIKRGNGVHAAMEQRITGGKPLPDDMRRWEPLVEPFARRGAKAEIKLAVSWTYQPTDYWGKDTAIPFVRGKADCVVVNNTHAYLADWKTGKQREDPFELEIGAMLLKASYPQLTTIIGTYIWLADSIVGRTHDLSDTDRTFRKCREIAGRIENDQVFEKREGPLCFWCDVLDCEHNRKPKNDR